MRIGSLISKSFTIYEKNLENKNDLIKDFKNSKTSKNLESAFPDAKLIDIKKETD